MKKDEESDKRGYRQYLNLVNSMTEAWRNVQSISHNRRKKADAILDMVDQIWGAISDSGLKEQFEQDWEELKIKYGHEDISDGDSIEDGFYHEFKRLIGEYLHKPELGMGLSKNTDNQADLSPPIRWGDRVRKRKLRGEFVNVDRDEN